MLVIKIFSERKKVFRERKKCEKIHAKRRKKRGLVIHDLKGHEFEKTWNNDKSLSEIQLKHEKEDEFVVVVVKAVHECRDCMMVVKEIVNRLLEEVEKLEWWFGQDIDDEEEEDEEEEDAKDGLAKQGNDSLRM
ncbi:hypothetical protein Tco_0215079 [Tanacetum coccineum]